MRIRKNKYLIIKFLLILCVFISILILATKRYEPPQFLQVTEFNPCYYLSSVSSDNYTVTVNFNTEIPEDIQEKLNEYIGYQTQSFKLPLIIKPGTPKLIKYSKYSAQMIFPMPFIQNYTGYLICSNHYTPAPFNLPRDILAEVDNFLELNMRIDHFRKDKEWSQLRCFGNTFETRYCDMRNVAIYKQLFFFASEADYVFPEPFLSSSGRAAPFDRYESRLIYEPIVIHDPIKKITELDENFEHYENLSYVISRFYNTGMLFHAILDFLVPAFHTFSIIEKSKFSNERYVFLRDYEAAAFPELVQSLSKHKIIELFKDNITRIFKRVIVGLEKLEKNPSAARENDGMLSIEYNMRNDTAVMLRDEVIKSLSIDPPKLDPYHPLILVVERTKGSRRILNLDEIEEYMLSRCDFCRIKRVDYAELSIQKQVELTAKSSVLFAAHGSGLSNCVWMKPSTVTHPTAVIEILPHAYTCRDWFHGAANISGADYYSVMSGKKAVHPNITKKEYKHLELCWKHSEYCQTVLCHDTLRDQNISIEIGSLSSVWISVVNKLKKAQQHLAK